MEPRVLAANAVAIVAAGLFALSYQMKSRRKIVIANAISRVIYVIGYIILEAYAGAALDIAGMLLAFLAERKNIPFIKKNLKWFIVGSNAVFIIINAVLFATGACEYEGLISLFALFGIALQSSALWLSNPRAIRIVSFIGAPFWLAYNIYSQAYISAVGDTMTMISIVSAFVRYDILKHGENYEEIGEKEMMKNDNNEAFDIVIIAGQSNAEGHGLGEVTCEYEPTERILQLTDNSKPHFVEDENGVNTFFIDYPSPPFIEIADEPTDERGKVGKLALSFAKEYLNAGLLSEGRRLLVINSAVGGSGFNWGQWGIGNILYTRLSDMLDSVLTGNSDNKIVAFLWHQGETDAGINREWDSEHKYSVHKKFLRDMMLDFCERYSAEGVPFISGGFCDEWYSGMKKHADPILRAVREVTEELGGEFVETAGLKSNNQTIGNGDPIHFSRESLHTLGKMYFEKFMDIKNGK